MQTIRSFAQLKSHVQAIKHEKNLRTEEEHRAYTDWTNSIHRNIFVIWVRLQLLYRQTLMTKNQYPYLKLLRYLPKVEHNVLWYKGTKPHLSVRQGALYINKRVAKNNCLDVCAFENLPGAKSVPSIKHLQVFLLTK
jgi:hypothetical protein